uniref:ARP901 n=1 Tax=Arundo donax TaxID=35708 RepID=A0A0A9DS37_ARUDO
MLFILCFGEPHLLERPKRCKNAPSNPNTAYECQQISHAVVHLKDESLKMNLAPHPPTHTHTHKTKPCSDFTHNGASCVNLFP